MAACNLHEDAAYTPQDGVGDGAGHRKRNIAYPKSYMLTADGADHYSDKIRFRV